MNKKTIYIFLFVICLSHTYLKPVFAEKLDFSSFYPAPVGRYDSIYIKPQAAIVPDTNCSLGTVYINKTNNDTPYFCTPGTPTKYLPLSGVWILNGNKLYPADTISRSAAQLINERVGIGTNVPGMKLTLTNDGGILALDSQSGAFTNIPDLGAGVRLMYAPVKGAFRAGQATGTEWNNVNIGDQSIAMGYQSLARGLQSNVLGGANNKATAINTTVGGGLSNTASGDGAHILGGRENNLAATYAQSAGYKNSITGNYSTICGGEENQSSIKAGTIVGGKSNIVSEDYAIASGGQNAKATGQYAIVSGGLNNTASGLRSIVSGGVDNLASATDAVVSGGQNNRVLMSSSLINGGHSNRINHFESVIAGGESNEINSIPIINNFVFTGIILGGKSNFIEANDFAINHGVSTIVGGSDNVTRGTSSIVAGHNMILSNTADYSFVWGHSNNAITPITASNSFIVYSGKMGIRDINPGAILEVNHNGSNDNYFALENRDVSSTGNKFIIKSNGRVGVEVLNPTHPLQFASGAFVSSTGNFQDACSRKYKDHIEPLSLDQARQTLTNLNPIHYHYKNEKDEEYLGFISEDVPDFVVDKERLGLSSIEFTAVLTTIVKDQQSIIEQNKKSAHALMKEFNDFSKQIKNQKP